MVCHSVSSGTHSISREYGAGELYAYLPQNSSNAEEMVKVPPRSVQHADYGFSVGMRSFYFTPGRWTVVAERVKMNVLGQADGQSLLSVMLRSILTTRGLQTLGEIEVFIDGISVIRATGLILRDPAAPDSHVQGLHFQTFFGGMLRSLLLLLHAIHGRLVGHSVDWASPQPQRAYFAHVSGAVLRTPSSAAPIHEEL